MTVDGTVKEERTFICSDGTCIPYLVRLSQRARRQRITLKPKGELEVVLPLAAHRTYRHAVLEREVEAFLEQHRPWIERAAKRTEPQRLNYKMGKAAGLPNSLTFPLAGESWLVEYRRSAAKTVSARRVKTHESFDREHDLVLRLYGNIADHQACVRALRRFVAQRARAVIPPFAQNVCAEIGRAPSAITVNRRKTAWGVCTRSGEIKIDEKVLFFPLDLARQVVLHEAAHLTHFDHSKQFYRTLFSFEGSTKEAEKAVKQGSLFVPVWMVEEL